MSVWAPAGLRYQWTAGSGPWASARTAWAGAPGRNYAHTVITGAQRPFSLSYQGFPEGLTYVLPHVREQQAALCEGSDRRDEEPVRWSSIAREARAPRSDVLVVGCSRERALALPQDRALALPFRVHAWLELAAGEGDRFRGVSPNERRQFAKLRRTHQWTCEEGTGVDDLRFFYERMHLPTMTARHGAETRSTDWAVARRALFRHGVLLYVTEHGKRVAGVLCRHEDGGTTLRMRLLGVLDGNETHYRSGAVKAVYYLTMEWAARHGVRQIDLSGADPFPGRGVFQFKRRLRPTVRHPQDHHRDRRVYLRIGRDTPAVRDFLVATPMYTVDAAGRIVATHFHDADRPPRHDIRADCPGVHESRTLDLDTFLRSR